jgi:protein involved in polysaccharide export with SLBB domain
MASRIIASVILGVLVSACSPLMGPHTPDWSTSVYVPMSGAADVPNVALNRWDQESLVPVSAVANHVDDGVTVGRYTLDTGDKLRVFVYGQPNLSRIYTVDQEGTISVPLIGNVKVRGRTTTGLEGTIRSRLGAQFVKDPQVTVDISQNRPFFILGEVRAAGQYPYVSGMTVQSAVAIAGGYSERANERRVQVTRKNEETIEKLDVPGDYVVRPGDTIYVYERWF